jgi:GAF domain-containing protein
MSEQERIAMGEASRRIIADWGLQRFTDGVFAAIEECVGVRRGFVSSLDRLILFLWRGRYRPT